MKPVSTLAILLSCLWLTACGGSSGTSSKNTDATDTAVSNWDEITWDQDNWQ
jgi:hypothetical protein